MKKVLLALAMLSLVGSAVADEANLFGGVLIAHHPAGLVYSEGEDWCARYADTYFITDAADQNPQIDQNTTSAWYVIAAFHEDKVWCGTQFGLGDYDAYGWYMTSPGGNCLTNSLEIPTPGWPGPLTGISIAATDVQYAGNFVPVYWFEGYTVPGYTAQVAITVDPTQDFIGFGNCEAPAGVWSATGGVMGAFAEGTMVFPVIPPDPVACCDEFGACVMLLEEDCLDAGGVPYPGEDCAAFECPVLVRACCFEDGSCVVMLPEYCDQNGGVVYEETTCDPNPCPPPMGACCYVDGTCVETLEIDCDTELWIMFQSCDPNECPTETSLDDPSWGTIKSMYR
jgi:hypothetical protein